MALLSITVAPRYPQFGWRAQLSRRFLRLSDPKYTWSEATKCGNCSRVKSPGKVLLVLTLLSTLPQPTLPILVGDDVTDESAFRALPRGLTIRVGNHPRTKARFRLQNPEEVRTFLDRLQAEIV